MRLPAWARFEGPTEPVADLVRGLTDAVSWPLLGFRFEAVLALEAARSACLADGLGMIGIVTGFMILCRDQL